MVAHLKIEIGPSQKGVKDHTKVIKPQLVHLLSYQLNVQIVYKTPWMFRPSIYKLPIQAYYQTIYVPNMNIS